MPKDKRKEQLIQVLDEVLDESQLEPLPEEDQL